MAGIFSYLLRYGAFFLFAVVFLEQIGVPLPAAPFPLAAGALVKRDKMNLAAAIGLATLASLLADLVWFYLGRIHGKKVLSWICRLSLNPDRCVIRTEFHFTRHGMRAVIFGKFIPGVNTVLPPMAGSSPVTWRRFIFFDTLSSLLYAGTYILLGYFFHRQLKWLVQFLERLGFGAAGLVIGLIVLYVLYRYWQGRRKV